MGLEIKITECTTGFFPFPCVGSFTSPGMDTREHQSLESHYTGSASRRGGFVSKRKVVGEVCLQLSRAWHYNHVVIFYYQCNQEICVLARPSH